MPRRHRARAVHRPPRYSRWSDETLLGTRICDLDLSIEGTTLERWIRQAERELGARGLRFRPHYWLAEEWFTPDGVPGIAIPFYLAHQRLARLERTQMLDVEGGTKAAFLRILRHEIGHAIDNAYRLQYRRKRQQIFGKNTLKYPEFYTPKPYSKRFVLHLDSWYAQSHPAEDFAETFAVWLTPNSMWEKRYVGWPALRKLRYMDELMRSIANQTPPVRTRRTVDGIERIKRTLREHYVRKRQHYGVERPSTYDRDLRRLFTDAPEYAGNPPAAAFVHRVRREVRRNVAKWTSAYQYMIDRVLDDIVKRCEELNLRLMTSEEQATMNFTLMLAVQTIGYLQGGRHRVVL